MSALDNAKEVNSGPGWYEVINPSIATTEIVRVMEDGSIYCPEGVLTRDEFAFAAATGKAHRLIRVDEVVAEHERVLAERAAPQEWEYQVTYRSEGAPAFDGYRMRHAAKFITEEKAREFAAVVPDPKIMRRTPERRAGDWEPLPEDTNQTEGENR